LDPAAVDVHEAVLADVVEAAHGVVVVDLHRPEVVGHVPDSRPDAGDVHLVAEQPSPERENRKAGPAKNRLTSTYRSEKII